VICDGDVQVICDGDVQVICDGDVQVICDGDVQIVNFALMRFCSAARSSGAALRDDADADFDAYDYVDLDDYGGDNYSRDSALNGATDKSHLLFEDGDADEAASSFALPSLSKSAAAASKSRVLSSGRGGGKMARKKSTNAAASVSIDSVSSVEDGLRISAKTRERKERRLLKGVKSVKNGGKIGAGGHFGLNASSGGCSQGDCSSSSSSSSSSVEFLPEDDTLPSPPPAVPSAHVTRRAPSQLQSSSSLAAAAAAAAAAAVPRRVRASSPSPIIIPDTPSPPVLRAPGKENAACSSVPSASKLRGKKGRESGAGGKKIEVVEVSSGSDGGVTSDDDMMMTLRERVLRMMKK
jgi:hypothetical protein